MTEEEAPYLSYLLRLWLVRNHEGAAWRCSVEDVATSERHGFADLEGLFAFLAEKTGQYTLPGDGDMEKHSSA